MRRTLLRYSWVGCIPVVGIAAALLLTETTFGFGTVGEIPLVALVVGILGSIPLIVAFNLGRTRLFETVPDADDRFRTEDAGSGDGRLATTVRGRTVRFRLNSPTGNDDPDVVVETSVTGGIPGELSVSADHPLTGVLGPTPTTDYGDLSGELTERRTGDGGFDDRFVVEARDERVVETVTTPDVRESMLGFDRLRQVVYDGHEGTVTVVGSPRRTTDPDVLYDLAETAALVAEAAERSRSGR